MGLRNWRRLKLRRGFEELGREVGRSLAMPESGRLTSRFRSLLARPVAATQGQAIFLQPVSVCGQKILQGFGQ